MRQLKWLSLLGLLLLEPSTYAQSVRFQSQAISTRGAGIANATVAICTQPSNTNTQPCSPLATLATSTTTTSGGANPLTADSFGNFFFYAAPGRYTVQIYGPAVSGQFVTPDVVIPNDPVGGGTTPISVGNSTFPCTATGINAALVAARGTGVSGTGTGVVDATACTGNITMNTQINVGDSTFDPVVLKLPASGGWDFNMTDGTSCGIKQFSKTSIIGPGGAIGQPFALLALTGANMKAVYCTDPSPSTGSSYIRAEGFAFKEQAGVTLTTAVADVRNTFDVSSFTDLVVGGTAGVALNVTSTCCGTTLRRVGVDCVNAATCLPIQVNANVNDTLFDSVSANHSGTGLNQISFIGATFGTVFNNLYMESNTTGGDTTTPLVAFSGTSGGNVTFQGGLANILSGSTTQYVFLRNSGAGPYSVSLKNFSMLPGTGPDFNCINDAVSGLTFNIATAGIEKNNGVCPNYDSGNVIPSLIVGRTGSPGAMFTLDYNASTEQPMMWRDAVGKSWLVGDGVTAAGSFSMFDSTDSKEVWRAVGGAAPSFQITVPTISTGTAAVLSGTGACATITTQSGGAFAGSAKCTGATAASTLTITFLVAASNGYVCDVWDETTRANLLEQTSHTTTTCVLTATSITQNDVFVFKAIGF